MPAPDEQIFTQHRWPFSVEQLPTVATWFDQLAELKVKEDVVAHSSINWIFVWRGEPASSDPMESPGGMLGIHLNQPYRITTIFTFRDLDQYASIKAALSKLELVELSDKHLKPKIGAAKDKKRKK
ncbi:MAG TPA: hypothetical protein VHD56_18660 [Tepidisphaeraceae bacterium]|nr:hypothetical protein [Tepidisphaeraceae bacterium]